MTWCHSIEEIEEISVLNNEYNPKFFLKWPQKQRDGEALSPDGTQTAGKNKMKWNK